MKTALTIIACLITCLLSTSCNNQGFCELDHPHSYGPLQVKEIEVLLDWSKADSINQASNTGYADPASVALYFYPAEGDPLHYEFTVKDETGRITGGKIKLPLTSYNVICINSDIDESLAFDHTDDFASFEVGPRSGTSVSSGSGVLTGGLPRANGTEEEPFLNALNMQLYTTSATGVTVSKETTTLVFTPEPLFNRYTVILKGNLQTENLSSTYGTMTGFVAKYLAGYRKFFTRKHTVLFNLNRQEEDASIIKGAFLSLGHCPEESSRAAQLPDNTLDALHVFTIYGELKDNTKRYHPYDVTGQLHDVSQDPRNVIVEVSGIDWELGGTTGGVHADVNGWGDVIPIELDI